MRISRKQGILGTLAAFAVNIFGCAPTELQVDLPGRVNPKPYYFTDNEGNRPPSGLDRYALITLDLDGDGDWDKIVWGRDSNDDHKVSENELYNIRFDDGGEIPKGIWPVRLPKQSEKKLEYPEGTLPSPSEMPQQPKPIEIPAEKREEIIKRFIDSMESLEAKLPQSHFSTGDSTTDAILTQKFQMFAYRLLNAALMYNTKNREDKLGVYVAIAGRGVYPIVMDTDTLEFKLGEPLGIEKMQEVERERAKRYLPQPTPPAEKPAEKPKKEIPKN
jgi:hypothetical protein